VSQPNLSARVARGVAWSGASQAIIALADLVSQALVLAVWVPAEHFGLAMAAHAFYTLLDTAADLGVTSSLIQRDDHTPERVSTVFWFNVLISGGLFLVLLVLGPLYGHLQGHAVIGWLLVAYGGKLLFQNVYSIPFAMLKKQLRFDEIAKMRTVAHLGESATRIAFAAAGLTIWCFTLAALVRVLLFGVLMQLRNPFLPRLVFRPKEVVEYVRFGLRAGSSQMLYHLYTNLDYPLVTYFFGATANGIYTLAYWLVLEPVRAITNVVSDVAFPTFARLRHDTGKVVDQLTQFVRLNLVAVLPFIALILLLTTDLLGLFGRGQWSPDQLGLTAEAARLLCFVGVLRAIGFLGPPLLDAMGRPELTLRYMVVAAVLVPASYLLCAVMLGDSLGLLSVAVAWTVAYPVAFLVLLYLVRETVGLRLGPLLRATSGIVVSVGVGFAAGLVARLLLDDAAVGVRLAAVVAATLGTTALLLVRWQGLRPSAIRASMRE
jgi:O-antigen/teichoic acid export membrane protein